MTAPLFTAAAIFCLALLYVLLPLTFHILQRYRDKKVVQCPETRDMVEVGVDARQAALSSAFGKPQLRIKACALWPKRHGCDQACVKSL